MADIPIPPIPPRRAPLIDIMRELEARPRARQSQEFDPVAALAAERRSQSRQPLPLPPIPPAAASPPPAEGQAEAGTSSISPTIRSRLPENNPYVAAAIEIAEKYNLPRDVFLSLVHQESKFDPKAKSPKGAFGLTQLMPGTARELGVDPRDPMANLDAGARYLRQQIDRFGSIPLALAAYNAGPQRVIDAGRVVPEIRETQDYVNKIMRNAGMEGYGYAEGGLADLDEKYADGGRVRRSAAAPVASPFDLDYIERLAAQAIGSGEPVTELRSAEGRGFAPMPSSFGEAGQRMSAVIRGDVEPTPEEERQINVVRGFTEGPAAVVTRGPNVARGLQTTEGFKPVFPQPERLIPEAERVTGGRYLENPRFDPVTRQGSGVDITGQTRAGARVQIDPSGKAVMLVSPQAAELPTTRSQGPLIRTNLFRRSAGWDWVGDAPAGARDFPTIVSVKHGKDHYYALGTDFEGPVQMSRYPGDAEPRLKPTAKGDIELGREIGRISVRGKEEHPVYDMIYNIPRYSHGGLAALDEKYANGGTVRAPKETTIAGQEHKLAYITDREAALLKARGGSGRMTDYGVRAYDDGGGDGGGGGGDGDGGGDGNSGGGDGDGGQGPGGDPADNSGSMSEASTQDAAGGNAGQGAGPTGAGAGATGEQGPGPTGEDTGGETSVTAPQTAPTAAVNPFGQTFHAALDFQNLQAVTPELSPFAAPAPFGTQGFGQAPSAFGMGVIGSMAGLGLGVPGLGMVGTAIGNELDVQGLNTQLSNIGLDPNIDRDQAALSAMSLGALGVSARDQFAQAMGFPSYDQSPMSSLNQQQGLPDAPPDTSGGPSVVPVIQPSLAGLNQSYSEQPAPPPNLIDWGRLIQEANARNMSLGEYTSQIFGGMNMARGGAVDHLEKMLARYEEGGPVASVYNPDEINDLANQILEGAYV